MKRIALIGLAIVMTACTFKPKPQVTAYLSVTTDDKVQAWSNTCRYNEYSCNTNSITNARSLHMGNGVYYTCSITGELYMSRSSYRAMSNLEAVKGASCKFFVTQK